MSAREQLISMLQEDFDTPRACELADELIAEMRERVVARYMTPSYLITLRQRPLAPETDTEICRRCGYRADQHRYDGACPTCDEDAAYYHEHDN